MSNAVGESSNVQPAPVLHAFSVHDGRLTSELKELHELRRENADLKFKLKEMKDAMKRDRRQQKESKGDLNSYYNNVFMASQIF